MSSDSVGGEQVGSLDLRLTTAIVSDALDAESFRDQVLRVHLTSLVAGDRAIGRARTFVFAPADDDGGEDPYRAAIQFIDSLEAGDLVVIATDESRASAFLGGVVLGGGTRLGCGWRCNRRMRARRCEHASLGTAGLCRISPAGGLQGTDDHYRGGYSNIDRRRHGHARRYCCRG